MGDRRNLFPEAARAVREIQPRAFVFENVKGLLRESFAKYFGYIVLQLSYPRVTLRAGRTGPSTLHGWSASRRKERSQISDTASFGVCLTQPTTASRSGASGYSLFELRVCAEFTKVRLSIARAPRRGVWSTPAPHRRHRGQTVPARQVADCMCHAARRGDTCAAKSSRTASTSLRGLISLRARFAGYQRRKRKVKSLVGQ